MKSPFDNPQEFLAEAQKVLQALQEQGAEAAQPLAAEMMKNYADGAKVTRGGECSGCASCTGCAVCGPSAIQAIQVGHSLQFFHTN